MEGRNRSARTKIWQDLAHSEMRIWLMLELKKYNVGYNEVEEFCLGLKYNFKLENYQNNDDAMEDIVRVAMEIKFRDEKKYKLELTKSRNKERRCMEKEFGKNTKTYRRQIRDLREAADLVREEMKRKYEKKVEHLRRRHRQAEADKDDEVPAEIGEYSSLSIFSAAKFEKVETVEYETKCLGELKLHDNEKKLMKLHTKFSVVKKLDEREFKIEQELAYTKARMEMQNRDRDDEDEIEGMSETERKAEKMMQEINNKSDEKEEMKSKVMSEAEMEEMAEEEEARTRQIYDPGKRIYDDRKRRVTDLKECSRVTLPKPLSVKREAAIELRRENHTRIFREYVRDKCGKDGEQKSNLSDEEKDGLKRIQKRRDEN